MSSKAQVFDRWIRGAFVAMNSELERLYFDQPDRSNVEGVGGRIKARLRDEGHALVLDLWREGNTGDGFEVAFGVLGNVGMYLAALRRHEMTNPAREQRSPFVEASSLAMHVGASIGMAPRFATAHLSTHNLAIEGVRKSFTDLPDESLFIDENTRAILSFQRAADALRRIVALGVTNPVADVQFAAAEAALSQAVAINERLFARLDVHRFFYSVRPYYKPYRVGRQEYRGANAGDFAGINEIDLLLGLCQASDPYYAQLLVDKMQFMVPGDQERLRECMRHRSLLDELLALLERHSAAAWFQENGAAFVRLCDLYARTARQHHDQLVSRFIEQPSAALEDRHLQSVTASGPPLPVLLRSLETLRDYRTAAPRSDLATRHRDLARLRAALDQSRLPAARP
jgi:hypothetical protein